MNPPGRIWRARFIRPSPQENDQVTAVEIAELAIKLCQLEGSNYSDDDFKQKFAFAFDLLVDADLQLQNLPSKIKQPNSRNMAGNVSMPGDPKTTSS